MIQHMLKQSSLKIASVLALGLSILCALVFAINIFSDLFEQYYLNISIRLISWLVLILSSILSIKITYNYKIDDYDLKFIAWRAYGTIALSLFNLFLNRGGGIILAIYILYTLWQLKKRLDSEKNDDLIDGIGKNIYP